MALETLRQFMPDYARDIGQNLAVLMDETVLSEQQKWGCFIASAYAVGDAAVIAALEEDCPLSPEASAAAKAAAAIMGMNNVYYRALHLMKNREYTTLPARLRMSVIGAPGAPKIDFELWCMAVSAINGCGLCLDSHEEELRKRAVTGPVIQAAMRIAAVVNAACRVMTAEAAARSGQGEPR